MTQADDIRQMGKMQQQIEDVHGALFGKNGSVGLQKTVIELNVSVQELTRQTTEHKKIDHADCKAHGTEITELKKTLENHIRAGEKGGDVFWKIVTLLATLVTGITIVVK